MINSLLKEQRRKQGKSIDDIVKELRIKRQAIIDIENGNYNPHDIYIKGYIRLYANHIGVVIDENVQSEKVSKRIHQTLEKNNNLAANIDTSDMPSQLVVLLGLLVAILSFLWIYLSHNNYSDDALQSNIKYLKREQFPSGEALVVMQENGAYMIHYKDGYEFFVKGIDSSEVKIFDTTNQLVEEFYLRVGEIKQLKIVANAVLKSNVPNAVEISYKKIQLPN